MSWQARRRLRMLVDRAVTEGIDREHYPSSRVQEHRVCVPVTPPGIVRDVAGVPVRIYLP